MHRESPYKRISTFLLSDKNSKLITKVFTLFVRSVRKGVLRWQQEWEVFSVSRRQVQGKEFKNSWKLCQKRCSFRWLNPRHKRVSNFNPSGLKMLKILFSNGRMKGKSFCLNALIVPEFLILRSRWNHSSSEAGKKEDLKYSIWQL